GICEVVQVVVRVLAVAQRAARLALVAVVCCGSDKGREGVAFLVGRAAAHAHLINYVVGSVEDRDAAVINDACGISRIRDCTAGVTASTEVSSKEVGMASDYGTCVYRHAKRSNSGVCCVNLPPANINRRRAWVIKLNKLVVTAD